nr:helix-turn-helix domain-containing protein [Planosporangium thailandense]
MAGEARRLRREGLSVPQIQARLGVSKERLRDWLRGVPPPEWTRRPTAKDDLRERALVLRAQGWSVNDLALELGIARSTAWRWVRHLPLDRDSERARRKREHAALMADGRWERHRRERDERHAAAVASAASEVGSLSDREVLLLGAAVYWCEGAKGKPWRPASKIIFTNSDPGLIRLFLRFLALADVDDERICFRLYIHETADVGAAEQWWMDRLGVGRERFQPTSLKRHRLPVVRKNTGAAYHGCIAVSVRGYRDIYWRIEGLIEAILR